MKKNIRNPKPHEKLISTRVQPTINLDTFDEHFVCVLKFGRKKSDQYRMPVVFRSAYHCGRLAEQMRKFKGMEFKTIDKQIMPVLHKFKKHDYRYAKKKP